jgi:flagellar biosynthesis GTPase FlhF
MNSYSSDTFAVMDLAEKLRMNQHVVRSMNSKDTILLMGTTNAGKTTTLCYLAGKRLQIRMEEILDAAGESEQNR